MLGGTDPAELRNDCFWGHPHHTRCAAHDARSTERPNYQYFGKVTLIQPGPFRTEFISRSLERATTAIEDYAGTSGKFSTFLDKMDGQQPGDPQKAADAILKIAESENPPLRVALGQYAVAKVERTLKSRQRELEAWTELGLGADRTPEA
jgi:hypothetical protein